MLGGSSLLLWVCSSATNQDSRHSKCPWSSCRTRSRTRSQSPGYWSHSGGFVFDFETKTVMGRTYPSEIKRILTFPGGDVGKECRTVALLIAEEARRQAEATFGRHPGDKVRTGLLAKSYQVKVVPGTNRFIVINPKKYAAAMEKGAKPHNIQARRVSHLKFQGRDGRWRNVKLVRHPGSIGRRTLETAMRLVVRRRYGVG